MATLIRLAVLIGIPGLTALLVALGLERVDANQAPWIFGGVIAASGLGLVVARRPLGRWIEQHLRLDQAPPGHHSPSH
ncbi:hypothetical protein [Parapedomonas caeni]